MKKFFGIIILHLIAITIVFGIEPSGSLPLMIIETEDSQPIKDKENYIKATYLIETNGDESIEPFSGNLQIKGRGNYTWDWFDKKPYRIKLDDKTPLLGFNKSKHFVLLAHADDNLGFLREPMGFKLSELAGLAWTPGQKPIELIINGDYRGLYFLVENIRIDKNRVNIFDQEEEEISTDVTGGWICELDNYEEPSTEQISIREGNGDLIRITHHNPEEINEEQENFLREQMMALDKAFYIQDPESHEYENLVDLESLSSFYLLQELMDGQESFHGSCYFHRDRGKDKKWIWGPVWDMGNTYMRKEGRLIYEHPDWGQTWIDQIVKFYSFQESYKSKFIDFIENDYELIKEYVTEYAGIIEEAAKADAKRWPKYGNPDTKYKAIEILEALKRRINFLGSRWDLDTPIPSGIYLRGDFNNWNADSDMEFYRSKDNTYIFDGSNFTGRFKIADFVWNANNWGTKIVNQDIPLDTPVELINGSQSKDMMVSEEFKSVIFKVIKPGEKATVELSTQEAGVIKMQIDKYPDFKINGREIYLEEGYFSIFDLTGKCLGMEINSILVKPGLYIVKTDEITTKIIIK